MGVSRTSGGVWGTGAWEKHWSDSIRRNWRSITHSWRIITAEATAAYQAAAAVIRQLAETISDAALKHGFLSNPLVASIMAAAHERARSEKE